MKTTIYLSLEEVLYLHQRLIERFGGKPGVRDKGLLLSALARPQSGYYETLCLQAAALLQSLCQNHCFIDGNKRVAFAATAVFLRLNGLHLKTSADEGENFIVGRVIKQKADLETINKWIEKYSRLAKPPPK